MRSNGGLSSGSNGHNGESVAHPGRVIHSKKPKRSRAPKRGPGVAELEKILREQENKKGVQIGGSRMFFPEHRLLPPMWDSSEYSINPMDGPKSFLGINQQFSSPYIMQKIDVFPRIAVSSAATTSTPSRLRDSSVESISNRASYPHFGSFLPDEHMDVKESEEAFQQRTGSVDQSVEKKPVCSFLHKNERINFNLNDEADGAEEDAIDLNLKL